MVDTFNEEELAANTFEKILTQITFNPTEFADIWQGGTGDKAVVLTGVGGFLYVNFFLHGRRKLPRKLKKRLFLTKKLRLKYLPEYYARKQ